MSSTRAAINWNTLKSFDMDKNVDTSQLTFITKFGIEQQLNQIVETSANPMTLLEELCLEDVLCRYTEIPD